MVRELVLALEPGFHLGHGTPGKKARIAFAEAREPSPRKSLAAIKKLDRLRSQFHIGYGHGYPDQPSSVFGFTKQTRFFEKLIIS